MTRALTATGLLSIALLAPVTVTSTGALSDPPLQIADLAWERGDYPAALAAYLRLLDSPDAAAVLEPIALRTGELYATTELTHDGAVPQFSPDGRYLLYETGPVATRVTRVIVTAAPNRVVVELRGRGAAFSPDGRKVAYWKPTVPATTTTAAAPPAQSATLAARATIHDLDTGQETSLDNGTLSAATLAIGAGDTVIFAAGPATPGPTQIHAVGGARPLAALTSDPTEKLLGAINSTGTALIFTTRVPGAGRGGRGGTGGGAAGPPPAGGAPPPSAAPPAPAPGRGAGAPATPPTFNVLSIPDGKVVTITGSSPSFSPDGGTIVFVNRTGDEISISTVATADPSATPMVVRKGPERVDFPAMSQSGNRVAFQMMPRDDWDIVVINRDGTNETRVTRDVQHDLLPQFLTETRLVGVIGEARHRRSFLYDLEVGSRTRLFHNNTVRTIAPEYAWRPSQDGSKLLIAAERDGDTVSLERGVYLMDLTRTVTRQDVRARVAANLAAEEALRAKGVRLYAPIAAAVKTMTDEASVNRIYAYEKALYDFDSKHITRPGNKLASAYLFETYTSFGYSPEFQWFDRANALGGRTANVIATLKGTVNPELIYVVSSHYDSVATGPGADDDSSGTAALLETARIMAQRPQAGDDRLRLVHRRGGGAARQPRVRTPGGRREAADRRRAQQRHGRVGERRAPRQHHPLLEPGHPRHPARGGDSIQQPHHLRRALLQGNGCGGLLRGLRRHRRRHRVVSGPEQPALPPVARRAGEHEPSAHHRSGEDDSGDAGAARFEPIAADGSEGGAEGFHRHGDVEAQP